MVMRLEQLIYFIEIAKYNSMSIAAEHLHIAQPSLSLAIKQLEQELDTKLFFRSRKGSYLTEQGQVIYAKVEKILDAISDLYPPEIRNNIGGTLTLLVSPSFNSSITDIIKTLITKFPKVKINYHLTNAKQINQEIQNYHQYDFILTTIQSTYLNELRSLLKEHTVYIISQENICLMCSRNSLYSSQKNISFSTLKKLPFVYYSDKNNEDDFLFACIENQGIKLHRVFQCADASSIPNFILNGNFFALTTPFILKFQNDNLSRDITLIPLKEKISISFILISKTSKENIPLSKIFMNNLKEYYPCIKKLS